MAEWSPADTPNFSAAEMACKCGCGQSNMDASFMKRLQELRTIIGPLTITSGYRCPDHNRAIGGGPEHVLGRAADIQCHGQLARRIVEVSAGFFPRLGISQRGDIAARFIHVGTAEPGEVNGASPWIWSY